MWCGARTDKNQYGHEEAAACYRPLQFHNKAFRGRNAWGKGRERGVGWRGWREGKRENNGRIEEEEWIGGMGAVSEIVEKGIVEKWNRQSVGEE